MCLTSFVGQSRTAESIGSSGQDGTSIETYVNMTYNKSSGQAIFGRAHPSPNTSRRRRRTRDLAWRTELAVMPNSVAASLVDTSSMTTRWKMAHVRCSNSDCTSSRPRRCNALRCLASVKSSGSSGSDSACSARRCQASDPPAASIDRDFRRK